MRLLFFLLLSFVASNGTAGELEFVGVRPNSTRTLFAIRDKKSLDVYWYTLGDRAGEFVLLSYDSKMESLVLCGDVERVVLKLKPVDLFAEQCAVVAKRFGIREEEVRTVVRGAAARHDMVVDSVFSRGDDIQVYLAYRVRGRYGILSGIKFTFSRNGEGRWCELETAELWDL